MTSSIRDWLGSMFDNGVLPFERRVMEAAASQMTGEAKQVFQRQVELIKKVLVDPFKTCFILSKKTCFGLIMSKKADECAKIETARGLILARVSGTLDGQPLTAEIGLFQGQLYAIVTNRPLSWGDRKRKSFLVEDIVLYPRIAPVPSDWEELNSRRDALSKIEIQILKPKERWLHPWDSAWYLCLADIGSQYHILQRCDDKGELVLLDYIDDEIVLTGAAPLTMVEYAYSHGDWLDDKNALREFERSHGIARKLPTVDSE